MPSVNDLFFHVVQNKLHYAAHGHTAAEVLCGCIDARPFMGLASFSGDFPMTKDIGIARNYLTEKKWKVLNGIIWVLWFGLRGKSSRP